MTAKTNPLSGTGLRCSVFAMVGGLVIFGFVLPGEGQIRRMGWGDTGESFRDHSPVCSSLPERSTLVVSFFAPSGNGEVHRLEAFIDFCTNPFLLPGWWRFDLEESCRAGAMSGSVDFSVGPFSHQDLWNGDAEVSVEFLPEFYGNPVLARIMVSVTPTGLVGPLEDGVEYYAFKIEFDNPATGCEGCDTPACFIVNGLSVIHAGGTWYSRADGYSNYATWQDGTYDCPFIVPVDRLSWGRLKATYD